MSQSASQTPSHGPSHVPSQEPGSAPRSFSNSGLSRGPHSGFVPLNSCEGPVVVLGASGLTGQALVADAQRRGLEVVGISRRKPAGIDLAQVQSLQDVLAPLAPALVINAAALSDPAMCRKDPAAAYAINTRLPGLLARLGVERGLRWVQVSADGFFSGASNVLHDEHAPIALRNEWARSRFAGEALARTDPSCLVLRTQVVGWSEDPTTASGPGLAAQALSHIMDGQSFTVRRDQWASRIEAGQFARAVFDLVDAGARGLFNLASRESASEAQWVHTLAAAIGHSAEAAELAQMVATPAAELQHSANARGLIVSKAEHWLGYPLPTTQEVVNAVLEKVNDWPGLGPGEQAAERPARVKARRLELWA